MSIAKELTGKQRATLFVDKKTQQVKPELVVFTTAFYNSKIETSYEITI